MYVPINIQCCLFVLIRLGLPIDNIYYYVNINNKLTQEKQVYILDVKENGSYPELGYICLYWQL